MNIQYKTFTETGLKRQTNQDRIIVRANKNISLFAIADGMGGHSNGELASETVIKYLDALWYKISDFSGDFQDAVDMVISSLGNANTEVFHYAEAKKIICGSTASALLICGDLYAVINVGDSPIYRADRKKSWHESTEHSYEIIARKSIGAIPNEIDERRKGRLVRAVGISDKLLPNVKTGRIVGKQVFLICSDGVSRYFTDKKIGGYLKRTAAEKIDLSELLNNLKNMVYSMGAEDNLSAIAVCYHDCKNYKNEKCIFSIIISAAIIFFILWAVINIFILL